MAVSALVNKADAAEIMDVRTPLRTRTHTHTHTQHTYTHTPQNVEPYNLHPTPLLHPACRVLR